MSEQITGDTSDGYHTFNELYEHRHALFLLLLQGHDEVFLTIEPWKTWLNQNGEAWDGWFIAGADTPYGQISYHLPAVWWNKLDVTEIERNADYDGHTSSDVLERLHKLLEG